MTTTTTKQLFIPTPALERLLEHTHVNQLKHRLPDGFRVLRHEPQYIIIENAYKAVAVITADDLEESYLCSCCNKMTDSRKVESRFLCPDCLVNCIPRPIFCNILT